MELIVWRYDKENMTVLANTTLYDSTFTQVEETVLSIILTLTLFLSLYGNIGMLVVLLKNDKMWNSTNILIGNLAFSGVLVSTFCMPFNLVSMLYSRWPFEDGPICQLSAFATSELILATILTHTLISVDKYFAVVKPFSRIMTVRLTWKLIFLAWFIAAIMTIGPLVNFGQYAFNPTTLVCGVGFPQKKIDSIYLFILSAVGFVIPNCIMVHVYIKVFIAVRKHSVRLRSNSVSSLDVLKLQKRIIMTTFLSLICFLACWTPFCVLVLMAIVVDSPNDLPHGLGVSAYWCGYLYNAINPLIICTMSPRFGDGFFNFTKSFAKLPYHTFQKCCYLIKQGEYTKGDESDGSLPSLQMNYAQLTAPNNNSDTGSIATRSPTIVRFKEEEENETSTKNKNVESIVTKF